MPEEEEEKGAEAGVAQAKFEGDSLSLLLRKEEEALEEKEVEEEPGPVQAKTKGSKPGLVSHSVGSVIKSLRGGGQPLSESSRAFFEPRFGADFSGVRVHTDANANRLASCINAKAFTLGHNVVFSGGRYAPETDGGKRLMAHELTHVVQQRSKTLKPYAKSQISVVHYLQKQAVQRKPDGHNVPYEAKILGTNDIPAERLKFVGEKEARVFNNANTNTPLAILKKGTKVTVIKEYAGGAWCAVKLEPPGIGILGGQRVDFYMLGIFIDPIQAPAKDEEMPASKSAHGSRGGYTLSRKAFARRKEQARKWFASTLDRLVTQEMAIASGGGKHVGATHSVRRTVDAYGLSIKIFRNSIQLITFDSKSQLLAYVDDFISIAEAKDSKRYAEIFRAFRSGILEEYESAKLRSAIAAAEEEAAQLELQIALANDARLVELLKTPLPHALDPKKSPFAAVAKAVAPITVPMWKAIVKASDIIADFIPFISNVKGGIEAFTGKTISGQMDKEIENPARDPSSFGPDMELWERILTGVVSLIPVIPGIFRNIRGASGALLKISARTGRSVSEIAKIFKQAQKAERYLPRVHATLRKLRHAKIVHLFATRTLNIGSSLLRKLNGNDLRKLYDIFKGLGKKAAEKFRILPDWAKMTLLGCNSPCDIRRRRIVNGLKGKTKQTIKEIEEIVKGLIKIKKSATGAMKQLAGKIHGLRRLKGQTVAVVEAQVDNKIVYAAAPNSGAGFDAIQKQVLKELDIEIIKPFGKEIIHAEANVEFWVKSLRRTGKKVKVLRWGISSGETGHRICGGCMNIIAILGGEIEKFSAMGKTF